MNPDTRIIYILEIDISPTLKRKQTPIKGAKQINTAEHELTTNVS
jgi:hypothetical protein